jgi:hypothetical protein
MEQSLEGAVSEKRNAPHRSGRAPTWAIARGHVVSGKQGSLGADAGMVSLAHYCPSSGIASEKLTLSKNLTALITDRQAAVAR